MASTIPRPLGERVTIGDLTGQMPEPLALPILNEPYSRFMAACARLKTSNARVLAKLAALHPNNISARIGGEFCTLLGSKDAGKNHVHIDVAAPKYYREPPQKLIASNAFARKIEPFFGQPVGVTVTGRFEVPLLKLPKAGIVRSTFKDVKLGPGDSLRQTSAMLSIAEKTKHELRLSFFRYEDKVRVELRFAVETVIDHEYLQRLHEGAFSAFRIFVLDQVNDDDTANSQSLAKRSRRRRAVGKR